MSLRKAILNGKDLFRTYWQEMGMFTRSLNNLSKLAPINPNTGNPFSKDALYKAMWRWACRPENEKEAYEIFRKSSYGQDPEWTAERFHAELKEKARWMLTQTQYKKWYCGENEPASEIVHVTFDSVGAYGA